MELIDASPRPALRQPLRIGAVSYLNTVPLVWGMLHGQQQARAELSFSIPSLCADRLKDSETDLGIVPVAEIARNDWQIVSDVGITCSGAVRSILLCSRMPFRNVKTLAADESSRTSVELARVILRERYGVEPVICPAAPQLDRMLASADAALVIGDPALRIQPESDDCECLDLGLEWFELTRLPMVFAAWAGNFGPEEANALQELTRGSYEFGKAHIHEIVEAEYQARGITAELAREYLTRHIQFEIGPAQRRGLQAFLELARLTRGVSV